MKPPQAGISTERVVILSRISLRRKARFIFEAHMTLA